MKTDIFKPERYIKREMIFVESAAFLPSILYTMTNDSPLGPEPPPMPSTASHAQTHATQHQQEPQRERERVSREEADQRSAGEPAARPRSSPSTTNPDTPARPDHPASRPPACIRYPCPASQHATRGRQRRKEGEGEERTGKRRAVAPHRPRFSR